MTEPTYTLRQRADIALNCLPDAPFKAMLGKLIDEMLTPNSGEAVAWRFVDDEDGDHTSFSKTPPTQEHIAYLTKWDRPMWEALYPAPSTKPADALDAPRYQWLRDSEYPEDGMSIQWDGNATMEEYIDAAMLAATPQGETK